MAVPYSHAPLVKKLVLKPGSRMLVIASPVGYRELLGELPADTAYSESSASKELAEGLFDWVHLFVTTRRELEDRIPFAKAAVKPGGVLWVSFPRAKEATDLNRTVLLKIAPRFGVEPVTNVAVNDDWTAYRLKPLAAR